MIYISIWLNVYKVLKDYWMNIFFLINLVLFYLYIIMVILKLNLVEKIVILKVNILLIFFLLIDIDWYVNRRFFFLNWMISKWDLKVLIYL